MYLSDFICSCDERYFSPKEEESCSVELAKEAAFNICWLIEHDFDVSDFFELILDTSNFRAYLSGVRGDFEDVSE